LLKAAVAEERLRRERELAGLEHEIAGLWRASGSQRESQEREAQTAAGVRKVVGQLARELANRRSKNGCEHLAIGEVA
jgi:hypothetical protein